MIQVTLCGMGCWGKTLHRVLSASPGLRLAAVVEHHPHLCARLVAATGEAADRLGFAATIELNQGPRDLLAWRWSEQAQVTAAA